MLTFYTILCKDCIHHDTQNIRTLICTMMCSKCIGITLKHSFIFKSDEDEQKRIGIGQLKGLKNSSSKKKKKRA